MERQVRLAPQDLRRSEMDQRALQTSTPNQGQNNVPDNTQVNSTGQTGNTTLSRKGTLINGLSIRKIDALKLKAIRNVLKL